MRPAFVSEGGGSSPATDIVFFGFAWFDPLPWFTLNGTIPTICAWREFGVLVSKAGLLILFSALFAGYAGAVPTTHKAATPARKGATARASATGLRSVRGRGAVSRKAKSRKLHGQQAIEPGRVMQIQEALIRERYLTGEPSGNWDATTQAAMQKYQADQGWQTRVFPDSRALKKLGLGPDYSGAINAEGASFVSPAPATAIPASQASGFAAASGVNQ
jgi:hypothetical protein